MRLFTSILLFITFLSTAAAQHRYMIHLQDKGDVSVYSPESLLSPRALENHQRNHAPMDFYDYPVSKAYVQTLNEMGTVVKRSKWLNTVVFVSPENAAIIAALPFVKDVFELETSTNSVLSEAKFPEPQKVKKRDYGVMIQQVSDIGVDCLHDRGYTGRGVRIAVIDAGFIGMNSGPGFDSVRQENRIVDTWDFVNDASFVYRQHLHGTEVASVMVGNVDGYLGTAPHAELCLYITEDITREVPEEELDMVRAMERADSVGADLVNISLGYLDYDAPNTSYQFSDLDGKTTISAKGIQVAAKKGLLVVTSTGNTGPDHMKTPCDADSSLCVGGTDASKDVFWMSSRGPAADGRIKPDVSAIMDLVYVLRSSSIPNVAAGTSYSCPAVCGMVACLLQANQSRTMMEVIEAVRQSGHMASMPNNDVGYGVPSACKADSLLRALDPPTSIQDPLRQAEFQLFPNPTTDLVTLTSEQPLEQVDLYSMDGKLVQSIAANALTTQFSIAHLEQGVYLVHVSGLLPQRLVKR